MIPAKRKTGGILGLSAVFVLLAAIIIACTSLGRDGLPSDADLFSPDIGMDDPTPRPPVSIGTPQAVDMRGRTPPEGVPVSVERMICDRPLDPNDFITDITGRAPVDVAFFLPPVRAEGEQNVFILLTDSRGNTAIITSLLTLVRDTEPPVISGDIHKTMLIGDAIAYRAGVTVTDNLDEHIALEVDSSAVDVREEGVYPVFYSATDSSGNRTVVEGSLTVYGVMLEHVEEMVEELLQRITTPEMTPHEVVRAIYDHVKRNVIYGSGRVRNNIPYAAYRGIRFGSGDCYTFFALANTLLNAAGIENIPVQRIAGTPTTHFWSLVNIGEGWYHFDPMPRNDFSTGFMLTEAQAQAQTRVSSIEGYYEYDRSLYPEVVP